jgi:hypothetical protein
LTRHQKTYLEAADDAELTPEEDEVADVDPTAGVAEPMAEPEADRHEALVPAWTST